MNTRHFIRVAVIAFTVHACNSPSGTTGTTVRRMDGSIVRGDLIHVYDFRNSMHEPRDEQFYALFDAEGFSEVASDDRSLVLVSSREIRSIEPESPSIERGAYLRFLQERGLVFDRLPLDGVWYVQEDGYVSGTDGDPDEYHRDEGGCGDFAWDVIVLDDVHHDEHCYGNEGGCTNGESNHDYWAWGESIYSPGSGKVVWLQESSADWPPYTFPPLEESNGVDIRIAGGYALILHHFRQDSVEPMLGESVSTSNYLGVVGNSGQSWAPHVHVSLYWNGADAPEGGCEGWSVPGLFRALHVSDDWQDAQREEFVMPRTGQRISNVSF